MPDEYDPDATSLDDSTLSPDGSQESDYSTDDETANPDDQGSAQSTADAAASATAVDTAATKPEIPAPTYVARDGDFLTKDEHDRLAGWLSEEAIGDIGNAVERMVEQRVLAALTQHDQQQDFARNLNIPPEYAPHVRAAMSEVPNAIVDPKARVEAAMFISMHKLSQQGVDVYDQMQAFLDARRGNPAPTPPARKPPAPLPPNAVTTRGSVTGATVPARANGSRSTDPLDKLFPFAARS